MCKGARGPFLARTSELTCSHARWIVLKTSLLSQMLLRELLCTLASNCLYRIFRQGQDGSLYIRSLRTGEPHLSASLPVIDMQPAAAICANVIRIRADVTGMVFHRVHHDSVEDVWCIKLWNWKTGNEIWVSSTSCCSHVSELYSRFDSPGILQTTRDHSLS